VSADVRSIPAARCAATDPDHKKIVAPIAEIRSVPTFHRKRTRDNAGRCRLNRHR
jgi:hypothetical protein